MRFFLIFLIFYSYILSNSFGNNNDKLFSIILWDKMKQAKLVGNDAISSHIFKGLPPHSEYIERFDTKLYIARQYAPLVIKKHYVSKGSSLKDIINNPKKYLTKIAVMYKRRFGYDDDNKNWFYAMYSPKGEILKNKQGKRLAGRVQNSQKMGCISCHSSAPGGDYIFSHDRYKNIKEPKLYNIK